MSYPRERSTHPTQAYPPSARALEENVYANQGKDGLFWYWWSWAERIAIADDLDAAATAIMRVLSLPRGRD